MEVGKEENMSISQILLVVFLLLGCGLGWKQVTNIMGPLRLDFWNMGALDIVFRVFHAMIKILLSLALGYIFFIIYIIRFIVARSKAKKAASYNAQNTSNTSNTQNTSEEDTTSV
jgi:hypothetical protein